MLKEITMDRVKTIRKKMLELQREYGVYLTDVEIVEEIDSQLSDKLSDKEYLELFNKVNRAYLYDRIKIIDILEEIVESFLNK